MYGDLLRNLMFPFSSSPFHYYYISAVCGSGPLIPFTHLIYKACSSRDDRIISHVYITYHFTQRAFHTSDWRFGRRIGLVQTGVSREYPTGGCCILLPTSLYVAQYASFKFTDSRLSSSFSGRYLVFTRPIDQRCILALRQSNFL
jgi:hypothetical protein